MLSVVAPLYNEGRRARALADRLRAMPGLAEAVLVDASDDAASMAVVDELESTVTVAPAIRLIRVAAPGRARQMNAGAAACTGDVLLFLHADTRLPGRAAERIAAAVGRGRRWGWFDLKLDARGLAYRVIERMISWRARLTGIATGDMALFVERNLFMAEGGFAELPLFEDVEFSRRLQASRRAGRPAVIKARATTSARRWRQHGVIRTVFLMWKLRFLYWRGRDPARLAAAYRHVRDAG